MHNSCFIEVKGSKIHYLEEGKGEPIVFLHGVPTSSYLWRNIMPALSDKARCIAPDLIGMGFSDKPDISYSFLEHIQYIEEFINKLNLKNITFVLHGLGSVIGFDYAMRHEDNIKGIAFYEAHLDFIADKNSRALLAQELFSSLSKDSEKGYRTVVEENFMVDKLLPKCTFIQLDDETIGNYKMPFLESKDRKPLWQYIKDFSFGEGCRETISRIKEYSEKLKKSLMPKLMLYTTPGFFTSMDAVKWCQDNLPNLSLADLDEEFHLVQESNPKMFGQLLSDWYQNI